MTATKAPPTTTSIEAWLDELHVPWTFEADLDLEQIDKARSLTNQARIGAPLDPDVVDRYTADYKRGDTFPPLLARRTSPRARLILLGGNHRLAAATAAGRSTHPVHIVECTDEVALTLMYGDNRRHGLPPSKTERCAQGAHLVANGWGQAEAAAAVGVSQPTLSNYLNVARTSTRAAGLGVGNLYDALAMGCREPLARIPADPVFVEATRLAHTAQLNGSETNDLVKRIRKTRSEADAMRIIGDELEVQRDRIQTKGAKGRVGGKGAVSAYAHLNTAVTTILELYPDRVVPPDPTSAARIRRRIKDAARRLMEIDQALGAR